MYTLQNGVIYLPPLPIRSKQSLFLLSDDPH